MLSDEKSHISVSKTNINSLTDAYVWIYYEGDIYILWFMGYTKHAHNVLKQLYALLGHSICLLL